MTANTTSRSRHSGLCIAAIVLLVQVLALADDEQPPAPSTKGRLDVMRAAVEELRVTSSALEPAGRLKFAARPSLRYNDQTRGLVDAALWRLGDTGRPTGYVTLEIYREGPNAQMLSYEFVSLSADAFEVQPPGRPIVWRPSATELKMLPLADAPPPAATARGRLTQFRQIAQRFTAHEKLGMDSVECRLLPQPIDRYSDADAGTLDGAVFAFANGTNPEVGLLLECTATEWSYGAFRLSSAEITASLDEQPFFTTEQVNSLREPVGASYRATRQKLESQPLGQ